MKKAKWIPKVEYSSREDMMTCLVAEERDEDLYEFGKYNEVEIAIVREDNKLGLESGGWDDEDKITLFSCDSDMGVDDDKEEDEIIEWWKKVTRTICDALNREKL